MLQSPFKIYTNVIKNVHHHFTRQTNHLHFMRGNNEFISRTFVFQSVFIWNTVIQNININVSYERFKHLLKDFLLSNDISIRYDKLNHNLCPLPLYQYLIVSIHTNTRV